jgi:HlyD family secretion protein
VVSIERQIAEAHIAVKHAERESRARIGEVQAGVEAARKRVSQAEKSLELAQTSQVTVKHRQLEVQTTRGLLDAARAAVEIARARMQTAEASLQLAQANLRDMRVTAPFTGTVLRKLVEPGEVVAVGTPLITLVDLANLHAKVYVAESDLGKIKVGCQFS